MTRHTIATAVALALTSQLAGCDKAPESPQQVAPPPVATPVAAIMPAPSAAPAPTPTPAPPPPPSIRPVTAASPLPGPTDRDPTHALAFWRAALERHDWAAARSVFGQFGAQSGLSPAAFAAAWDKYRIVDVTVGTGEQDGAAGSSYYEVPVTITGLTKANQPYHLAGRVTLRRVNDVDGATPEQLRWHIERSTLQP
ncbi:MAG: hypothetical protein ABIQ81_01165 [Novosphingobium sp.]